MALTRSDTPNSHTFDQRLLDQIIFWFHNTKPSELVICCPFVLIPSATALRTATLSLLLPTIPSPDIRYLLCSNFLCHTTPVQITTINMLLSAMNTSVSSSPCSFFPIPHRGQPHPNLVDVHIQPKTSFDLCCPKVDFICFLQPFGRLLPINFTLLAHQLDPAMRFQTQ